MEEAPEPATDHAARGGAAEQSAQSALEEIAEPAAHTAAGEARGHVAGRGRGSRLRCCAGLVAAKMLDRFPGEQRQDRHGHRRHAATFGLRARCARAARALLHAVEYVE